MVLVVAAASTPQEELHLTGHHRLGGSPGTVRGVAPFLSLLPPLPKICKFSKLCKYPNVQAIHIYCDGSVNGSRSGCGLFIRDYFSASHYIGTEVSRRLPAHMSSTRAELYAVLEALHIVAPLHMNVYFFIDSQVALYAL
ncbi:hypothetical protein E2C01_014637 [Portunus trituberculatus]|uniref:RNase H type-1 domain-containing protein n=1 Tax=Portunus trituberculatus TaxID=210409 RepID=A0A5B7DKV4_PORTR|nr:hypothetical protein [Portunus trituberculatus]